MKMSKVVLVAAIAGLLLGCNNNEEKRLLAEDIIVEDPALQLCIDYAVGSDPDIVYADEVKSLSCKYVGSLNGIHRLPSLESLAIILHYNHQHREERQEFLAEHDEVFAFNDEELFHPDDDHGNVIHDLTPLTTLSNLKLLLLEDQEAGDLSALGQIPSLESIYYVGDSDLNDISFVTHLPKLKYLNLAESNIYDITPLSDVTSIESLTLTENNIETDISLGHMSGLQELRLTGSFSQYVQPIVLLESIKDLPKLELLDLSFNWWYDIPTLNQQKMRTINLDYNFLSDTSVFANLTSAENVSIVGNWVADITDVSKVEITGELILARNMITTLPSDVIANFAENSPNMRTMNIHCNEIPEEELDELKAALPNTTITGSTSC